MVEIVYTNWYDGVGFLQIVMCDLVLRSYTNSGVRIGNTRGRWWITNSYMRNSIVRNTIVSKEVETDLLKRDDANSMVANCLRWIGWKGKLWERDKERVKHWSGNTKCQPEWIFCFPKWKFEIIRRGQLSHVTATSNRTYNARTQQNDPKRIWRRRTNSYRHQIIHEKITSLRKKYSPFTPGI